MLSVIHAECRKYSQNGECHYAECRYVDYLGAVVFIAYNLWFSLKSANYNSNRFLQFSTNS
jgi:hypothetical protein